MNFKLCCVFSACSVLLGTLYFPGHAGLFRGFIKMQAGDTRDPSCTRLAQLFWVCKQMEFHLGKKKGQRMFFCHFFTKWNRLKTDGNSREGRYLLLRQQGKCWKQGTTAGDGNMTQTKSFILKNGLASELLKLHSEQVTTFPSYLSQEFSWVVRTNTKVCLQQT